MYKKILLPTDGSKNADKEIETALNIIDKENGEIIILSIASNIIALQLPNEDEVISLNKLSTAIYWNTKRIDRKRDRLKVALEELSENKIVVREASYSKKDITFDITYIPLSRNEMAKINIGYDEGNLIENKGSIMI